MSVVHILIHGQAICGAGFPTDWKNKDDKWVGMADLKNVDVLRGATNLCKECGEVAGRANDRSAPGDKVAGHLLIGVNHREVVMNFGDGLERDSEGRFFIAFSPSQARALGNLLREKATEAENT